MGFDFLYFITTGYMNNKKENSLTDIRTLFKMLFVFVYFDKFRCTAQEGLKLALFLPYLLTARIIGICHHSHVSFHCQKGFSPGYIMKGTNKLP